MNVMVTGGAGFIGSHVCEALLDLGHKVVCVDNFDDLYDPKIKEKNIENLGAKDGFSFHKADIRDYDGMKRVFSESSVDKVVHLAAKAGVRASIANPKEYEDVNVNGTRNMLELCREFNIKGFVFGSSSSVYGVNKKVPFSESDAVESQISPYAKTKRDAEILCQDFSREFGLDIVCFRFFTVYGPRGRPDMAVYKFTQLIDKGSPVEVFGRGNAKRDFTYVKDIADGVAGSIDRDFGFEIINLGSANPITVKRVIKLIEANLGKKAKMNFVPPQEGDVPITYADISKAKKLLGYSPGTGIEQGI